MAVHDLHGACLVRHCRAESSAKSDLLALRSYDSQVQRTFSASVKGLLMRFLTTCGQSQGELWAHSPWTAARRPGKWAHLEPLIHGGIAVVQEGIELVSAHRCLQHGQSATQAADAGALLQEGLQNITNLVGTGQG